MKLNLLLDFQFHVNSGILGSVDVSWLSHVDPYSEDLGSCSRLPRLEVFTLEFHIFSCFCNLIIPSCIVGIQSLPETGE